MLGVWLLASVAAALVLARLVRANGVSVLDVLPERHRREPDPLTVPSEDGDPDGEPAGPATSPPPGPAPTTRPRRPSAAGRRSSGYSSTSRTIATSPTTTITARRTVGDRRRPILAPSRPPIVELTARIATTGQLIGATTA